MYKNKLFVILMLYPIIYTKGREGIYSTYKLISWAAFNSEACKVKEVNETRTIYMQSNKIHKVIQ